MPTLTITKTYSDGTVLTEADLDNFKDDVETFLNTTKIDQDNIQTGGVNAASLATDSVETVKIKALNVTTAKLAANSVTSAKLASGIGEADGIILPTQVFS